MEHIKSNSTGDRGEYVITLSAPVIVSNLTCQDLQFQIAEAGKAQCSTQGTLGPGVQQAVHFVDVRPRVSFPARIFSEISRKERKEVYPSSRSV